MDDLFYGSCPSCEFWFKDDPCLRDELCHEPLLVEVVIGFRIHSDVPAVESQHSIAASQLFAYVDNLVSAVFASNWGDFPMSELISIWGIVV